MKKIIQKYGNALIIRFNQQDIKIFNIKKGDIINIKDFDFERQKPKLKEYKQK